MADEHSFQKAFKLELEKWNVHCPSLVASMFMAGMPDLILNTAKGYTYYIELKYWRNVKAPQSFHDIQGLLKGPQIAVIKHTLWKRGIVCPIIAQNGIDNEWCFMVYKDQMKVYPWKELCKCLAACSSKDDFLTLMQ